MLILFISCYFTISISSLNCDRFAGSSVGDIPEELKLLRNEILASKVHNVLDSLYGNSIN